MRVTPGGGMERLHLHVMMEFSVPVEPLYSKGQRPDSKFSHNEKVRVLW